MTQPAQNFTQPITPPPAAPSLEDVQGVALQERAMLVSLSIKTWSPRKLDKTVTEEVAQQKAVQVAAKDAGAYSKKLIPRSISLEAVRNIMSSARNEFYNKTLPWAQDGARIISPEIWMELAAKLMQLEQEFNLNVEKFIQEYPALVSRAQNDLGDLYDARDYPSAGDLRSRFEWRVSVYPLPNADDFRVNLDSDVKNVLKAKIEADVRATLEASTREAYQRLSDRVERMVERFSNPDQQFRESLITGLEDTVKTVRGLNIAQDAALEETLTQIDEKLLGFSADNIKGDPALREQLATDAKTIFEGMSAFLGGGK